MRRIVFALGLGPLLLFTGELNRARRRTLAQYGDFVREYTMRFHAKWIDHPPAPAQPLGTPDIQSLNDLGAAFQVITRTRGFVFGLRQVFIVGFTGILPMTPLLVADMRRILETGDRPPDRRSKSFERVDSEAGTYWRLLP